jgi:hypothetical protein
MTIEQIPTAALRRELERRQATVRIDPIAKRSSKLMIASATCYGIAPGFALLSRNLLAVRARWAVWRQLALDGYSSTQIGKAFNRDHGTIINGWAQAAKILPVDPCFSAAADILGAIPTQH